MNIDKKYQVLVSFVFSLFIFLPVVVLGYGLNNDGSYSFFDKILNIFNSKQDKTTETSAVANYDIFSIRNLVLDTKGKITKLISSEPNHDAVLTEYTTSGGKIKDWKVKYEQKGNTRDDCNPPMMNMSFDKADSKGNPKELFTGQTTYNGLDKLQYQKVRLIPECDIWNGYRAEGFANFFEVGFNGKLNATIREYIIQKVLREFGVPVADVIGFANITFISSDSNNGKTFRYMMLQRPQELDDQLPFTKQFGLNSVLYESNGSWILKPGFNDLTGGFIFDYKQNNGDISINLDSNTTIKFLMLIDFFNLYDMAPLYNEDFGIISSGSGVGKVVRIPHGFDASFSCNMNGPADVPGLNTSRFTVKTRIDSLPNSVKAQYQNEYYRIAREVFSGNANLNRMLKYVDSFPYNNVEKDQLKEFIKIRFYQFAKYYSSPDFSSSMGQGYNYSDIILPFSSDQEYDIHKTNFLNYCLQKYRNPNGNLAPQVSSNISNIVTTNPVDQNPITPVTPIIPVNPITPNPVISSGNITAKCNIPSNITIPAGSVGVDIDIPSYSSVTGGTGQYSFTPTKYTSLGEGNYKPIIHVVDNGSSNRASTDMQCNFNVIKNQSVPVTTTINELVPFCPYNSQVTIPANLTSIRIYPNSNTNTYATGGIAPYTVFPPYIDFSEPGNYSKTVVILDSSKPQLRKSIICNFNVIKNVQNVQINQNPVTASGNLNAKCNIPSTITIPTGSTGVDIDIPSYSSVTGGTGQYSFTPTRYTGLAEGNYKPIIHVVDNGSLDRKSADMQCVFSVVKSVTTLTNTNQTPIAAITSPEYGSTIVNNSVTNIAWNITGTGFDRIQVIIGNFVTNSERPLYDRVSAVDLLPGNQRSFNWNVPDLLSDYTSGTNYTKDQIKDSFYIQIRLVKDDGATGKYISFSAKMPIYVKNTLTNNIQTQSVNNINIGNSANTTYTNGNLSALCTIPSIVYIPSNSNSVDIDVSANAIVTGGTGQYSFTPTRYLGLNAGTFKSIVHVVDEGTLDKKSVDMQCNYQVVKSSSVTSSVMDWLIGVFR